jgi:septin family protein
VLPIIGRADILTTAQRDAVKHVVWRDLLAAGLADNFSILEHFCQGPAESESLEVQTQKQGQQDTGFDHDYMKRSSDFDLDLLSTRLPLFCVNPEQKAYSSGETGKIQKQEASSFIRRYVWGGMDILDSKFGDTGRLYSGLLSQALATVSERINSIRFPFSL